jgi:hypothetical protein
MSVVNLNYIPSQATHLVQAYYVTVWRLIVNNTQIISCFTTYDLVVLCTEISHPQGIVPLSTQEYYIPYSATAVIVLYEWSHLKKHYITIYSPFVSLDKVKAEKKKFSERGGKKIRVTLRRQTLFSLFQGLYFDHCDHDSGPKVKRHCVDTSDFLIT